MPVYRARSTIRVAFVTQETPAGEGEGTTPGADENYAAPGGAEAAPGGTKAAPGGTEAAPGGTEAAPGGTEAAPGGTEAAPGGPDFWLACPPGQTMAQAVYLSGHVTPPALCSGLGVCGRCRVRVIGGTCPEPLPTERRLLSPEELDRGWRLSCRHRPAPGMILDLPGEARPFFAPLIEPAAPPPDAQTAFLAVDLDTTSLLAVDLDTTSLLAVDLGTTSLEWSLLWSPPSQNSRILWQGKSVNPQMGAGSDVISRLSVAASPEGRSRLCALTRKALRCLVEQSRLVLRSCGLPDEEPVICLAANTAMTAITLDLDTKSLAGAPYSLPYAGGQWEALPDLPPLWTPPQLSPFVGGDISAGYAALALDPEHRSPRCPFLLADLGTNGEFLLALSPDIALAASVALGPALEGIGLSHGVDAQPGAVADFSLGPYGLVARRLPMDASGRGTPADRATDQCLADRASDQCLADRAADQCLAAPAPLPGITGTGYLALLHILLTSGAVNSQGQFTPDNCGPLRRFFSPVKAGAKEDAVSGDWIPLPFGLRLTAKDVEELLKVKAAFSLGLRRLLAQAGISSRELTRVCVAGALGKHVNKQALESLGFFPPGMQTRLEAVGNTSLAGALLLGRSANARSALTGWAARVKTHDLASDPVFTQNFAEEMRFVW